MDYSLSYLLSHGQAHTDRCVHTHTLTFLQLTFPSGIITLNVINVVCLIILCH